jgi:hypothetical protein
MPIRPAVPGDLPEVASLIQELASYEGLAHEVTWDPDQLHEHLFGPDRVARATLAVVPPGEPGDRPGTPEEAVADDVAGLALWFPTFSTFLGRPGIWVEDLYVRPRHLRSLTDGRVEWAVLDWNDLAISFYEGLGAEPVRGWTRYRWSPPDRPPP